MVEEEDGDDVGDVVVCKDMYLSIWWKKEGKERKGMLKIKK